MKLEKPESSAETERREETPESRKIYQTEEGPVEVSWEKFDAPESSADKEKEPLAKAVLFLPGWAMTVESESIKPLGRAFAERARVPAYNIFTRSEKVSDADMLYNEAEAVRKFIEENKLTDIVIGGHSQGGDKAIDLVNLLQEKNPEIEVKGLILLDSVGVHAQTQPELVGKFIKDAQVDTPGSVVKSVLGMGKYFKGKKSFLPQSLKAGSDMIFGILREVKKSGVGYPKRLLKEIASMAKFNDRIKDVHVPVVMVQGERDPISAYEKLAPVENPPEREAFLKDNIFKNSPSVKMIVAEKAGHHGVPLFRPESVARASLYMLERFYRKEKAE